MREFLTATDVEDLVARGVRQIAVGDNIILTDLALERATTLGVTVIRGAVESPVNLPPPSRTVPLQRSVSTRTLASAPAVGSKPKGCLHSHIESDKAVRTVTPQAHSVADSPSGSLVDRLVDAVRRLSR
jgi:hypothetical protein